MKTEPKFSKPAELPNLFSSKEPARPSDEWPVMLWLAAGLALLYFLASSLPGSTDPASRRLLDLTAALATEGSPAIDHFVTSSPLHGGFLTVPADAPNTAYYAGHYYADSAPGVALLAVLFYGLGRFFGPEGSAAFGLGLTSLAGAGAVLAIYGVTRRLGSAVASARYAALSVGVASVLWREAGRFGPGVFSTLLLALALWLVLPPLLRNEAHEGGARLSPGAALWLGLVLGFAGVVDYPNLLWTPFFVFYLWQSRRLRLPGMAQSWGGLSLGFAIGLGPLALYNWLAFGRPWTFSFAFLLNDPQARTFSGQFLGGFNFLNIRESLFGPERALLGPFVLLFGLWGLAALYGQRGKRPATRFFMALTMAIFVAAIVRRTVGVGALPVDYLAPVLPLLAIGTAVWHERFMFLTRLEQWWLPGLATLGIGFYYWLCAPGPLANFDGVSYGLPLLGLVAAAAGLLWWALEKGRRHKAEGSGGSGKEVSTFPFFLAPLPWLVLAGFVLSSLLLVATAEPMRPAFAQSGSNNLLYNGSLNCENGTRMGWYFQGQPFQCDRPQNLSPGQTLQPFLIPVQGGKVYQLEFEAGAMGAVEWRWTAEPVLLEGPKFNSIVSQPWKPGLNRASQAAPPGVAYLQLGFQATAPGSLSDFRFWDDSVRVEPMKNYAKAALSFTFDWESAMGGLIHSQGGAPVRNTADGGGQALTDENLKVAIADAERRGLAMRNGADYLLELFERYDVRGTFYANGYNLLDGNKAKLIFAGNPTYQWASPRNNWASDFWTKNPWYKFDPYGDYTTHPAWYFGDQTDRLSAAGQDIQSHTFGHLYIRGTRLEEFMADTEAFVRFAREKNLPPVRHFAFPWTSSNSVKRDWYVGLASKGFSSVTRLYYTDQGINSNGQGRLEFDNGRRDASGTIVYEPVAGPNNHYYYLGQIPTQLPLLVLNDYKLWPGAQSEATARALVDELLRRRGYGSIWTHPEEVVAPDDQALWARVVEYATSKREDGLWVDSVANLIQHRRDIAEVGVASQWSNGGRQLNLTVTNRARNAVDGLTLTLPAPVKAATGALSFKEAQVLVPALQSGQCVIISIELK